MDTAKRFYTEVTSPPVEGGYTIHLDGKPVRTPLGAALVLPVRALAEAIAAEWQAQGETIDPASMPLGGYANTAIDRVGNERQIVMANMMQFAETDTLCYRTEEPAELANRQYEQWQPILDWVDETFGAPLTVTSGVLHVVQPDKSLQALRGHVEQLDDMEFTALASLAAVTGSFSLALALAENHVDTEKAFQLAQLDEVFQRERWGRDAEAEVREQQLKSDLSSTVLFLALLRQ